VGRPVPPRTDGADAELTFIVFDGSGTSDEDPTRGMIGDVNLFLLPEEDDTAGASASVSASSRRCEGRTAEIMVMTAEPGARRCGMGREAVVLMLQYGAAELGIAKFVAKILSSNTPSLSMFQDRLGFSVEQHVPAFDEVHLSLSVSDAAWETHVAAVPFRVAPFDNPDD
jgi:RimJ/RimL family protein N-acetyltransferase